MHPRNRYTVKPDFGQLAEFRPSLKPFLIQKRITPSKPAAQEKTSSPWPPDTAPQSSIPTSPSQYGSLKSKQFPYTLDFSDPAALRELTCAVLERDFDLNLEMPLDRLIPAVPQRLNYIHWIEDLLSVGTEKRDDDGGDNCRDIPKGDSIIGIDIGTGASCIYPLLGCRLNSWRFLATEVDSEAVKYAVENVERNELSDKIQVKLVPESTTLLGALDTDEQYSFCMCNPPFFKDADERYGGSSRSDLRPPPSTFSGATAGETVTEGGEEEFVKRIIRDSLVLNTRVRWYSSMLGKKASLKTLLAELKKHQVPVVTSTEFIQGKTWRWALAWSYDNSLKDEVKKHFPIGKPAKRQRPITVKISSSDIGYCSQPSTLSTSDISVPTAAAEGEGFLKVRKWLLKKLSELEIECTESEGHSQPQCDIDGAVTYCCRANRNTWSHQRKKKRLLERLYGARALLEQQDTQGVESHASSPLLCDTGTTVTTVKSITHKTITAESLNIGQHDRVPPEIATPISSPPHHESTVSSFEELRKQTELELEALSPPCKAEFKCSLILETSNSQQSTCPTRAKRKRPSKPKKSKTASVMSVNDEEGDGSEFVCCLEFEWIHGDDKDQLHQIVQYIKNQIEELKTLNFDD